MFVAKGAPAAFGAIPTGIKLGWWVQSGFGLNDFPQRVTPIVYLRCFSQTPRRTVFVPEHHREIAARIFAQLGREVEFGEESGFDATGEVVFAFDEFHRVGMIMVVRPGAESCKQVLTAYQALIQKSRADAVFVDIFVDQGGAAQIFAELERSGFFFSGVQPHVKFDRDLLRLQIQHTPIDLGLIQTANDIGRELLAYWDENAIGFQSDKRGRRSWGLWVCSPSIPSEEANAKSVAFDGSHEHFAVNMRLF